MDNRRLVTASLAAGALAIGFTATSLQATPVVGLPGDLAPAVSGLFLPSPDIVPVQCGSDGEGECTPEPKDNPKTNTPTPSNPDTTDKIVDTIEQAKDTCSDEWIDQRYRVDCIRQTLLRAARELPDRGDYAPMKAILEDAAAKLGTIVAQNPDRSAGTVTPNVGGRPLAPTLPPLRAIDPAAQEQALEQAVAVLEETETLLLRSAAGSSVRLPHYELVAQAVDSTKVLLRSS